jgi:hypothetical protein
MCEADLALAWLPGEVSDTDCSTADAIGSAEDEIEELLLLVLEVATESIRAEICNLNHACELAVHEQGGFNDVAYLGPKGPLPVIALHKLRMLLGDRIVVVVDEQTWVVGLVLRSDVLEIGLESGH